MLKKLRRKIMLINMSLVSIVLLTALVIVSVHQLKAVDQDLYHSLQQAARFAVAPERPVLTIGEPKPEAFPPPMPNTACVILRYTQQDGVEILEENNVSISDSTLSEAVARILEAKKSTGKLHRYRLAYYRYNGRNATYIALSDLTASYLNLWSNLLISSAVFFSGVLVFYFITLGLSSIALKPVDQAWKQQKRFIADASHELKTPLTVIMANLNILSAHKSETVAQQEKWLASTADEAEAMKALIDQMLLLAKADATEAVQTSLVNCSELVEEQLLYLDPVAYEHNVTLQAQITPDLHLHADPHMLQHLVSLLVENAIKFSPSGSEINVTLRDNRSILLSVHNWGPAIPEEDLPHLFERFYRSDKARSSEGSGLGLAIAQSIVERLHGKLWVVSNEAAGTTFFAEFRKGSKI